MSAAPTRSFTLLAAAIVIAAIVISATLFVTLGTPATVTKTVPEITITAETTTMTSISTDYVTVSSSESSQTSLDTTVGASFYYSISINYSGSWNLVYWGQNGTLTQNNEVYCNECYGGVMQYNVNGNLSSSGNYQTEIVTHGVGYVENVLCVDAAILNAPTGTLTLTVVGTTGIATAPINPTVEVCVTQAV